MAVFHYRYHSPDSGPTKPKDELKGMSDERQNPPILSPDKIAWQKSVVCHAKIAQFRRPR